MRNLSLITHFFLLRIQFPPNVVIFYSYIFEYITFDLFPPDKLYALIIDLDETPFSDAAGEIGYDFRRLIPNTGTVTIFIVYTILVQVLSSLILCCTRSGRMHNFARSQKTQLYFSGFTNLLHETSLMMSFGVCINLSMLKYETITDWINNIYAGIAGVLLVIAPILIALAIYREFTSSPIPIEICEGGSPIESPNGNPYRNPTGSPNRNPIESTNRNPTGN